MTIRYLEKGIAHDFRRVDHEKTVSVISWWRSGGLLYGYRDRFNIVCIAIEDIISISNCNNNSASVSALCDILDKVQFSA